MCPKSSAKVQHTDVSWDNYFNDSLKAKHEKKHEKGVQRRVNADTRVPNNWEAFLTIVNKNKEEQFSYLSDQLTTIDTSEGESIQMTNPQILNGISVSILEGSGWTVESVDDQYINIVKYKPFKGSSYIELPLEIRNPAKGLINLKNKDNECFRWCHICHLNPQTKNPQRIKKCDKEYIEKLDYVGIKFPVIVNQYNKTEKRY